MNPPLLLRAFVLAACLCGFPGSPAESAEPDRPRPNIVFIMVDDLGKEWVGCYGGETDATPEIDALAATGMKFHNAYSMPQCTPTRATLLTGQYPFRHGWVNHWDVPRWGRGCHFDPERNPSIGRVLQSAGYRTCIAGKWQINDFRLQPEVLVELGFDEYCMWTGYESGNPPSAERYWDPYLHTKQGSKTYSGQFGPTVCNDFVLDFLDQQDAETPFFIYYPMILPHTPFTSTPHKPDVTGNRERHIAMVEYLDFLTGGLVRKLDETGLRENTIVIWTTDNGTTRSITNKLNGRLVRGAKGQTLENGTCQPFIINGPGLVPEGVETDALSDFTDLLPTFAELAGADSPAGHVIDGQSFTPLILGKADDGPREWIMAMGGQPGTYDEQGRVINVFRFRDRVVRNKRYKLYVETDRSSAKLVDLREDPDELVNRLDDPELAEVRTRLEAVAASFPDEDASPRYSPLPPQPWDVVQKNPGRKMGKAGLPSNAR
jgi:arylsulfatase A-like enzyme